MRFRLIASDLDGTLLPRDGEPTARTVDAIARAQDAGAPVVIATARAPWSTRTIAEKLGVRGLAVCMGGAAVYDLDRGEVIEHATIDLVAAHRVVTLIREKLPEAAFACSWPDSFAHEPSYRPMVAPPEGTPVGDVLELLQRPVHRLTMKHPGMNASEMVAALEEVVRAHASISFADETFVEIVASGVSKASALERICERRGIQANEVLAFGDYPNDAAMLAWAGHGVAVANAHPAVRAAADEVTTSNEDDGVARVLERMLDEGRIARA